MKLKFGKVEIELLRIMDTASMRDADAMRRIIVTIKDNTKTVDELKTQVTDCIGDFTIENNGVIEEYTGFDIKDITRNTDEYSTQTTITFEK